MRWPKFRLVFMNVTLKWWPILLPCVWKKCCPRNEYNCRNSKFAYARHPSYSLRVAPRFAIYLPALPPPKVVTVNQAIAFWTSECCQFNHYRASLIKVNRIFKTSPLKRLHVDVNLASWIFAIWNNFTHFTHLDSNPLFFGPSQPITALHDCICWICFHHPWMP